MSIEASLVVPMVLIIIAIFLVGFAQVSEMAFFDHEDGVSFLLSISKGASINRYSCELDLIQNHRVAGTQIEYEGKHTHYSLYKPSRMIYGVLFGNFLKDIK